jgi:hypothetical protein
MSYLDYGAVKDKKFIEEIENKEEWGVRELNLGKHRMRQKLITMNEW